MDTEMPSTQPAQTGKIEVTVGGKQKIIECQVRYCYH